MRLSTLAFLSGILLLQFFHTLPTNRVALIIASLAITSFYLKKPSVRLLAFSALGFSWCIWYANTIYAYTLPHEQEGKSMSITGYIASIPAKAEHGTDFLFAMKSPASTLVKLNWPDSSASLKAGDKWQFTVRLKQIHGLMNPGGFDYEAWAFQKGIRSHGYVVIKGQNKILESNWYQYPLLRLRQTLKQKISDVLPASNTSPWITALAIGERDNISPENWQVLRNTGTNHLMAIAGLHIGFITSFVFSLTSFLWRRSARLTQWIPATQVGAVFALGIAIIYSALAGFSTPTQRACIMILTAFVMMLFRRRVLSWLSWCMAMLIVLLLNPLSVLTESFWLSFAAVAFIIYGISARLQPSGLWWKVGRIQWVISLGLIPLSIWLFQQCSIVAFLANCVAIPMVGFLIVPLTLSGCFLLLFSTSAAGSVLLLADKVLSMLWLILSWFSHLSWGTWYQVVPHLWILITACVGIVLLLAPKGFPGRGLGMIWLAPMFFYHAPQPAAGEVWFTLLDVGQGLASVVQTQHHTLVFDTGPKLSVNYDMGDSVVVPFLRSIDTKKIDMLVVSHGDNDHIGGAATLLRDLPVTEVKTSVPENMVPFPASYCLQGESWQWDTVKFEFLYPTLDTLNLNNNSSCVLKVTNAYQQSVLLTGDIEKFAETILLKEEKQKLSSTILIAPHHGSKTSDLDEFIDVVHPRMVLFPVGYLNRFHFPHNEVLTKYKEREITMYQTDKNGAVQIKLNSEDSMITLYRQTHEHYWQNQK